MEYKTTMNVLFQSLMFGSFLSVVYVLWDSIVVLLNIRNVNGLKLNPSKSIGILKRAMTLFLDVLYFVIVAPICAIFFYGINFGIVRWYIVVSILCGFYMYIITIGRLEKKIIEFVFINIRLSTTKILRFFINNTFGKIKLKPKNKKNKKDRVVLLAMNSKTGLK